MERIFLVEDDPGIAEALGKKLQSWGYRVVTVKDFSRVLEEFRAADPHLVLLDIGLPLYDGYHWCAEIRKESHVPVVFLSSAADNLNIIMAMNMGADDFVTKPFDIAVLSAKIQAILRRAYDFGTESPKLALGEGVFDPFAGAVSVGENRVELSKNEARILEVLLGERGKIVSREKLMRALWDTDQFVDENTLSVNVNRLRRKLASVGLDDVIRTRFGEGYAVKV